MRPQISATWPTDRECAAAVGHEILRTKEEIDFLRLEDVLFGLEVDGVQNQIQVVAVGFDLRMMYVGERIFDGEIVEVEDLAQHFGFFRRG